MTKQYVSLSNTGIEFKQLVSGPAQIGKILNYIMLAGQGIIKHRGSKRYDTFENNVGNERCLDFMVGLGLIEYEPISEGSSIDFVKLTSNGLKIYNILTENAINNPRYFDMGTDPEVVLKQLEECNALNVVYVIEDSFRDSIIYKNLCIFLGISQHVEQVDIPYVYSEFRESRFGELRNYYVAGEYTYNGEGASTGGNRVPSLVQLLLFLGYVEKCKIGTQNGIKFKINAFRNGVYNRDYALDTRLEHLISEYEKEERILNDLWNEDIINKLGEKYGIQGTRTITTTVRLSQAQLIFKERLKEEIGGKGKCCLCGIHNDELLIGSHIKDAAICNIHEKADNNNGLLLCAMHDKLFDRGLITFNFMDGNIRISKKLDTDEIPLCNINKQTHLGNELLTDGRKQYLMWHNHEFHTKNHEFYE